MTERELRQRSRTMRRLPLATFVAAFAAAFLSAPALAEQGGSDSLVVGGGSYVALDDATVLPPIDACPNLDGIQDTVPAHLTLDPHGNCIHEPSHEPDPVPTHHDACPNLDGIQDTVPAHMTLDPHGNCIHEPSHHHRVPAQHALPAAAQVEHWHRKLAVGSRCWPRSRP